MRRTLVSLAPVVLLWGCGPQAEAPAPAETPNPGGRGPAPSPTELVSTAGSGEGVAVVEVGLNNEIDVREYRVYRSATADGPWDLVNTVMGQGEGAHGPRLYHVIERGLEVGQVVYYAIERESIEGAISRTGAIEYHVRPEPGAASSEATAL